MKKVKEKEAPDLSSLLVFGYACKLFRDDERALSIESGNSLIPWMGDPSLRIDRYDGRGHLPQLAPFEAGASRASGDDELEKHEEALVDEERWRSLHEDDSELDAAAEETEKRSQGSAQIGLNYASLEPGAEVEGNTFGPEYKESEAEEEEVYTGGAELMLPPFTKRPPTVKLFRAIEKTALFLAGQGAQMEILLKAKQSGNPVFDFLSVDSPLHPFYRHLVSLVKSGQYKRGKQSSPETIPKAPPPPAPLIHVPRPAAAAPSSIPFKPSEDCAYSQLVNRLKPTVPAVNPAPPTMSTQDPSAPYPNPTPPQPPNNGVVAPIVASYGDTRWGPQVAPPPTLPQNGSTTHAGHSHTVAGHMNYPPPPPVLPPGPPPCPVTVPPGPIIIPPPDVQPVIDKMASYVAKNGRSFEDVVRSRPGASEKFSFLTPGDRHHNYYVHKLAIYTTGSYDSALASVEPTVFKVKKQEEEKTALIPYGVHADENNEAEEAAEANESSQDNSEAAIQDQEDSGASNNGKRGFPNLVGFIPPLAAEKPDTGEEKKEEIAAEEKQEEESEGRRREREEDEKEMKRREEEEKKRHEETTKLRDKLAAKARDKMVQAAKEKALQLERKRKAASFLALLAEKKTTVSSAAAVSPQTTLEDGEVVEVEAEAVPHQPVSAPPPALQAPHSFNFQQCSVFFTLSQESSRPRQIAASSG